MLHWCLMIYKIMKSLTVYTEIEIFRKCWKSSFLWAGLDLHHLVCWSGEVFNWMNVLSVRFKESDITYNPIKLLKICILSFPVNHVTCGVVIIAHGAMVIDVKWIPPCIGGVRPGSPVNLFPRPVFLVLLY